MKKLKSAIHAYIYGRWTKQYVHFLRYRLLPRMSLDRKIKMADGFHCKVLTTENASQIIKLDKKICKRDLEQIIPYSSAKTLVLKGPPDIAIYECACRHSSKNPCQPTKVCMMIGKPIVDFILKTHPNTSHRATQAEALDLLQSEHERGHVHTAWFRDALGGRFYAICNCCKCCCFGIEAMKIYDAPMVASSGYIARVDTSRCSGCEHCVNTCPFGAIAMDSHAEVKWEDCMGCGVCVGHCPNKAIDLSRDEKKGVPLDVRMLT